MLCTPRASRSFCRVVTGASSTSWGTPTSTPHGAEPAIGASGSSTSICCRSANTVGCPWRKAAMTWVSSSDCPRRALSWLSAEITPRGLTMLIWPWPSNSCRALASLFCWRAARLMSRPTTAMTLPLSSSGKAMLVTSLRLPEASSKYGSSTHAWRLSRAQV
ncbi:hypothetical protein D3C73_1136780 [compost metagenome]